MGRIQIQVDFKSSRRSKSPVKGKPMDIATVAKASGMPASTLRYYEERGLIQSQGRSGLRRLFHANVLERLALISLGRRAGLTLDEIASMMTPSGPAINRTLLSTKADELDSKIQELIAMRDGLRHAAACKASSHLECPTFQKLLQLSVPNKCKQSSSRTARPTKRSPPTKR
jgi:DNA-binding transcriptional MerR regulator